MIFGHISEKSKVAFLFSDPNGIQFDFKGDLGLEVKEITTKLNCFIGSNYTNIMVHQSYLSFHHSSFANLSLKMCQCNVFHLKTLFLFVFTSLTFYAVQSPCRAPLMSKRTF